MKEQNISRETIWLTEGNAALKVCESVFPLDPADEDRFAELEERLSPAGRILCGMAALLEEILLFLMTGIRIDLTPPVTVLFLWITLAVISTEFLYKTDRFLPHFLFRLQGGRPS